MVEPFSISVIVAVRNGEKYLMRALQSVLAQVCPPQEILVVDGGSTDQSRQIAESAGVRVVQQVGQGIADAYNCGIAASAGDLVAFLSSDDEWTPDKLQVQAEYMKANPELLYTLTLATSRLEDGHTPPAGFRMELLEQEHSGAMETLMARRDVFKKVGPFDTRFQTAEDLDWFARANDLKIPMARIPRVLLLKYVHDANLSLTTPTNNQSILTLLRQSIQRKNSPRRTIGDSAR
jgi:glycosyltransferase involved in cell wall biosynthesis